MDWMKIVAAMAVIMFIVFLFPRARDMMENSPKGTSADWMSFVIPIVAIVLFVMLLIQLV